MTLLDRFRTPSARTRHPDPQVRLVSVAEIPLSDREAILAVAREDEDPKVRRAAVLKLLDPAGLAEVAGRDGDESVRVAAQGMLRDLALEVFEGLAEAEALTAVDALEEPRLLVHIARTATRDTVAMKALGRVQEPHALGGIARHAMSEAARQQAVHALEARGDHAELLGVALNSEFKDTALIAVESVTATEDLEQIAVRGHNKSAAKRARTLLRERGDGAGADEAARIEPLVHEAPVESESERAVAAPIEPVEMTQQPEETEGAAGGPLEIPETAAQPEAAAAPDRDARLTRLSELAAMARAVAAEPDASSAERGIRRVRREWREVSVGLVVDPELASQLSEAETEVASRVAESREADARRRRESLEKLQQLASRAEALTAQPDLTRKTADRALREVRAAMGSFPALPTRQDADDLVARFRGLATALTTRVGELREAEDWKRWANVTLQEQLCARMEALAAKDNPEEVGRELRQLQQEWRAAADVPREKAEALWRRFKTAHDVAWSRCQAGFAAEAVTRADNLARKTALCERAEALADSTSWIQTAEALKALQNEWKTIGPVSRGHEKAVWERFRAACDRFFTRRHDDLVVRKKAWSENLAKKTALCERAEALAESSEWDQAAGEVKRLQAEWKTLGPVKKSRSEAIWQRFHGACDRFFARYAARHDEARAERIAAREAICAEVEALTAAEPEAEAPAGLAATLRAARGKWQHELAARGVDPDRARALDARFQAACAAVVARWPTSFAGTDFDPDANRRRMEALVRKVEDLAATLSGPAAAAEASPAERLAAMLKEALAANTIGGKIDEQSRWREAAEEVRRAQGAWSRLGPLNDDGRALADRFQRACRAITDKAGRAGEPGKPGREAR